jgi:hypothetical protein
MTVTIREAGIADLPAILALYAQPEIDDGAVLSAEEAKAALSANAKRQRAYAFYESLGFQRHGYSFLVDLEDVA